MSYLSGNTRKSNFRGTRGFIIVFYGTKMSENNGGQGDRMVNLRVQDSLSSLSKPNL